MTDPPILTPEQQAFARRQMSRWLRVRAEHEALEGKLALFGHTEESVRRTIMQLAADVDHSALLVRLLSGRDPLPEPPPKEHAYPVYPDDSTEGGVG